MARFVSLKRGASSARRTAGLLVLMGGCSMAQTQPPTAPATPPPPQPQAKAAPPAKPASPPPPDSFNRFGKIWAPSDDVSHPIKLIQFPSVGDMRIPSQDELNVRDKLEQLAALSDADIHKQLEAWPPYSKMKLGDQGQLLGRIQAYKDQRTHVAMQAAHDMGLLTLTPEQQARFEKDYWAKRLAMERDLAKQFEPVIKTEQQKMADDLFREFSTSPQVPIVQAPKPAVPSGPPPTNKPAQTPPPVTQTKPAPTPPPVTQTKPAAPGAPALGAAGQ